MPSPSANHFFSGDASLQGFALSRPQGLFRRCRRDLSRTRSPISPALGCTYLQIDEVPIAVLCDPKNRAIVPSARRGCRRAHRRLCRRDQRRGARTGPPDMTVCVHLCRGNHGHGQASGGYDPVAERFFERARRRRVLPRIRHRARRRLRAAAPSCPRARSWCSASSAPSSRRSSARTTLEAPHRRGGAVRRSRRGSASAPQCGFASSYQTDRFTASTMSSASSRISSRSRARSGGDAVRRPPAPASRRARHRLKEMAEALGVSGGLSLGARAWPARPADPCDGGGDLRPAQHHLGRGRRAHAPRAALASARHRRHRGPVAAPRPSSPISSPSASASCRPSGSTALLDILKLRRRPRRRRQRAPRRGNRVLTILREARLAHRDPSEGMSMQDFDRSLRHARSVAAAPR